MKLPLHPGLGILVLATAPALPALPVLPGGPAPRPAALQDPAAPDGLQVQPAVPTGEATMLRLRDGAIRWGVISDHDPDGFRFSLLAHGGSLRLPWSLLDPLQEKELRERFGYVDVSSEELMIDVDRLTLIDGHEVSGVILSREGNDFVVKVDGNLQMVPKRRVRSITRGGRLPALDVYSREELYGMFVGETDPDDPAAQLDLAQRCERILDFEHAVQHYERVLELDDQGQTGDVEFALVRARRKAAEQEQIDYLRDVDQKRKRGQFDEALASLEAFETRFPDSPLVNDAKVATDRVLTARDAAIRDLVRRRWNFWMRRLCRSQAAELDYAGAVEFAEERLSQEIQEHVLEDVRKQVSRDVQPEAVLAFWATRRKQRFEVASYGLGTWLLGEDRALAGTDGGEKEAEEESELSKDRAKLEEKIKRFLANQQARRRARARAEQEDEFETYWRGFPLSSRAQWIRAYYVEFGGDFELRDHPLLRNCPTCGGTGVREIIHSGGSGKGSSGVQLIACPSCRGIARIRRIYYR